MTRDLADLFRPVEVKTLERAKSSDPVDQTTADFTKMHNISKHCIYVIEVVEAAIQTVDDMLSYLIGTRSAFIPISMALTYRRSTFKSTRLRLHSLEKRIAGINTLSFDLITQQDSRVMQNDSSAIKAIAVMTLIFLPATGISSIFGMPFFETHGGNALNVATSFWVFWVFAIPMTAIIFLAWLWIYRSARKRRSASTGTERQNPSFPVTGKSRSTGHSTSDTSTINVASSNSNMALGEV